jgi:uncharacterized protein (TIGR02300 family)
LILLQRQFNSSLRFIKEKKENIMADRGLKRLCGACGTKFYDFGKLPIVCPSCETEFTGEVVVKSRRAKSSIVADTVTRADIEKKNREALTDDDDDEEDDDTISLDDVEEDNDDDLDDDIDLDDIDDSDDDDDDLSDLEGDVDIDLDKDKD